MSLENGRNVLARDASKASEDQERDDEYWRLSRTKLDFNQAAKRTAEIMSHSDPLTQLSEFTASLYAEFPRAERALTVSIDQMGKAFSALTRSAGTIFSNGQNAQFDLGIDKPVNHNGKAVTCHLREQQAGRFAQSKEHHVKIPKLNSKAGEIEIGLGPSSRMVDNVFAVKLKPVTLKAGESSTYIYVPSSLRDGICKPGTVMSFGNEPLATDDLRIFLDKTLMAAGVVVNALSR